MTEITRFVRPPVNEPHRRLNPLNGEWVIVSPHRVDRPWKGEVEPIAMPPSQAYDPHCQLCPGNVRGSGARNPPYRGPFVFDNDFPALLPEELDGESLRDSPLVWEREAGICRVVCSSPRHDLSMATMSKDELLGLVEEWTRQYRQLTGIPWIQHVQIFENRGALMGASSPHPHSQIWANQHVPHAPATEISHMRSHLERTGKCLLCEYIGREQEENVRITDANGSFLSVVPFWANWPFETLLLPARHVGSLLDLTEQERIDLSDLLGHVIRRYDRRFGVPFPYSFGFHQSPPHSDAHETSHLHAHFFPPLLRSATVRKFMVGYEMLCGPQRDIAPELAAARLREAG